MLVLGRRILEGFNGGSQAAINIGTATGGNPANRADQVGGVPHRTQRHLPLGLGIKNHHADLVGITQLGSGEVGGIFCQFNLGDTGRARARPVIGVRHRAAPVNHHHHRHAGGL